MTTLALLLTLTAGVFPSNGLLDLTGVNPFTRVSVEFTLYDLVYVCGDVTTYFDGGYGGAFATFPVQADYIVDVGLHLTDWLDVGFTHTCYHPYLYRMQGLSVVPGSYFGVKDEFYIRLTTEITLVQ